MALLNSLIQVIKKIYSIGFSYCTQPHYVWIMTILLHFWNLDLLFIFALPYQPCTKHLIYIISFNLYNNPVLFLFKRCYHLDLKCPLEAQELKTQLSWCNWEEVGPSGRSSRHWGHATEGTVGPWFPPISHASMRGTVLLCPALPPWCTIPTPQVIDLPMHGLALPKL